MSNLRMIGKKPHLWNILLHGIKICYNKLYQKSKDSRCWFNLYEAHQISNKEFKLLMIQHGKEATMEKIGPALSAG
jgi:hypothetical protein